MNQQTVDMLTDMKLSAMAAEFTVQLQDPSFRALSFEEDQHATIVPELLIDEDDVQASHAMSMGSVDPDHLYYMQTRGLTMSQCISLISTGYLLPIADTIKDETLREKLREQLEKEMAAL